MSLPPGARITTRRLLHALNDKVWQVYVGNKLIAERLSVIDEDYANELIRTAGSFVHVVQRGKRFDQENEA